MSSYGGQNLTSRPPFVQSYILCDSGGPDVLLCLQNVGVQMSGVQMSGVQMSGVQMSGVQMSGVQMSGVQMSDSPPNLVKEGLNGECTERTTKLLPMS